MEDENQLTTFTDLDSKKELLRSTICKGSTDDEFELFILACKRTGLDPFAKQVYAVKRWNSSLRREEMTIQTSIDGFRLIAERTGHYSPGKETSYTYDVNKKIVSATAYIKKLTKDGTWHEVPFTAFYEEYVQRKKDKTVTQFWQRMPHVMLSKCAESMALRKAFPVELSGIYTNDEMAQAKDTDSDETNSLVIELYGLIGADPEILKKIYDAKVITSLAELSEKDLKSYIHAMKTRKIAKLEVKDGD